MPYIRFHIPPAAANLLLLILLLTTPVQAEPLFRDLNGDERTIDEFRQDGRWLVVMIWASDCHVCNAEARQYVAFHEQHRESDAVVLGISLDGYANRRDAATFIERNNVTFPNVVGEASAVNDWYTAQTGEPFYGTPTFLIFGPSGELLAKQPGAVPVDLIESFIARNASASG